MKLFIDSNLVTYWSRYDGYIMAGEQDDDLPTEHECWQAEVHALKTLLDWHDVAGFRFAVSPTVVSEMARSPHAGDERTLLSMLIEHTLDCIEEEGTGFTPEAVDAVVESLRPAFASVTNDCRAVAEAIVLECDAFLTNDRKLARMGDPLGRIAIVRPTDAVAMWRR